MPDFLGSYGKGRFSILLKRLFLFQRMGMLDKFRLDFEGVLQSYISFDKG
jgi:hypothetical protein